MQANDWKQSYQGESTKKSLTCNRVKFVLIESVAYIFVLYANIHITDMRCLDKK